MENRNSTGPTLEESLENAGEPCHVVQEHYSEVAVSSSRAILEGSATKQECPKMQQDDETTLLETDTAALPVMSAWDVEEILSLYCEQKSPSASLGGVENGQETLPGEEKEKDSWNNILLGILEPGRLPREADEHLLPYGEQGFASRNQEKGECRQETQEADGQVFSCGGLRKAIETTDLTFICEDMKQPECAVCKRSVWLDSITRKNSDSQLEVGSAEKIDESLLLWPNCQSPRGTITQTDKEMETPDSCEEYLLEILGARGIHQCLSWEEENSVGHSEQENLPVYQDQENYQNKTLPAVAVIEAEVGRTVYEAPNASRIQLVAKANEAKHEDILSEEHFQQNVIIQESTENPQDRTDQKGEIPGSWEKILESELHQLSFSEAGDTLFQYNEQVDASLNPGRKDTVEDTGGPFVCYYSGDHGHSETRGFMMADANEDQEISSEQSSWLSSIVQRSTEGLQDGRDIYQDSEEKEEQCGLSFKNGGDQELEENICSRDESKVQGTNLPEDRRNKSVPYLGNTYLEQE
ncbi:uncharacterized protein LOC103281207 isoform X2 [Anolis carolinensis]|uniref:uncharacterized protein LOC103281207 isoform X2 n=1 Tax=Anolis carolinensis TaxID=28377 RepID=UPI002F2B6B82